MFARSPAGSVSLLQTEPRYQPLPLDFTRLDPEEARRRSREFLELMRERRSVRNFSTEPVDRELIENAIRTAAVRRRRERTSSPGRSWSSPIPS